MYFEVHEISQPFSVLRLPTILDRMKWNNCPPSPQSNDEGAKEQKRAILASLKWGEGWSICSIYFVQDCSFVSKTAILQLTLKSVYIVDANS